MPLRSFGSVSKAELLKTMWVSCSGGTEAVVVGNHPAYRVDHAGDQALMEVYVPPTFTSLHFCYVQFIARAAIANMTTDINVNYGTIFELYNNDTGTGTDTQNTIANTIAGLLVGTSYYPMNLANLRAGDRLGVRIVFNVNTNIEVLGLQLEWA